MHIRQTIIIDLCPGDREIRRDTQFSNPIPQN